MSDLNRSSASQAQRADALHHILSKQPQRESNPRLRSDSPVYSPLYYKAIFVQAGASRPALCPLFNFLSVGSGANN